MMSDARLMSNSPSSNSMELSFTTYARPTAHICDRLFNRQRAPHSVRSQWYSQYRGAHVSHTTRSGTSFEHRRKIFGIHFQLWKCCVANTGVMAEAAAASAIHQAAAVAFEVAASIRDASMSKGGRKDHLKKIGEFKSYLATNGHAELLSNDAKWKHGVNVDELGKKPHVVEQFFLSLRPKRVGTGVNVPGKDSGGVTIVKGLPALKKYRASITFLFTENCVQPSPEYQLCMTRFFKGLGNIDAADTSKPKTKKPARSL